MSAPYLTLAEAAVQLGLSDSRVRLLCKQGRIAGAVKLGRAWLLPSAPVIAPPRADTVRDQVGAASR